MKMMAMYGDNGNEWRQCVKAMYEDDDDDDEF